MAAPRKHRDQTYRKSDLVRAFRAAEAAGVKNPRIEIDRHGTISIIPGNADEAGGPDEAGLNDWDSVLSNDAAAP